MAQFSSNTSLEKQVEIEKKSVTETNLEDINWVYEIKRCAEWIQTNNYKKVCLQFPDCLLTDSSHVVSQLQQILQQTVYILGDTAYESCCIDYVAASHIPADAIIHFGPICLSQTSEKIPHLNIYEKFALDIDQLEKCYLNEFSDLEEEITILLDSQFIHVYAEICDVFSKYANITIKTIADKNNLNLFDKFVIFLGDNNRKLLNIYFNFRPKSLYYYSNNNKKFTNYIFDNKILKRKFYLIEKIKDSQTFGIIIGTLAVKNYLLIIERLKKLFQLYHKKYYIISVGKPTIAKLANFPEIDIYVLIACQMNEIYDNYKEYYKPILTPHDIEMALNPTSNNINCSYDYNELLSDSNNCIDNLTINPEEPDISLLTGKIRQIERIEDSYNEKSEQIALKDDGTISLNTNYGAGFLAGRSWKGLEQNLGESEIKLVEEGRTGLAECYGNEILQ